MISEVPNIIKKFKLKKIKKINIGTHHFNNYK